MDFREIRRLQEQGVPDPDGTSLGNLHHTLAVHAESPDDLVVLSATSNVYETRTGLTLGDLRNVRLMDIIERQEYERVAPQAPAAVREAAQRVREFLDVFVTQTHAGEGIYGTWRKGVEHRLTVSDLRALIEHVEG